MSWKKKVIVLPETFSTLQMSNVFSRSLADNMTMSKQEFYKNKTKLTFFFA